MCRNKNISTWSLAAGFSFYKKCSSLLVRLDSFMYKRIKQKPSGPEPASPGPTRQKKRLSPSLSVFTPTWASVSSEPETAPFCFLSTWWAATDSGPSISSRQSRPSERLSHFHVSFLPLPVYQQRCPPPAAAPPPLGGAASPSGCSAWPSSSCSWGETGPGWTGGRWTWPGNEGLWRRPGHTDSREVDTLNHEGDVRIYFTQCQ